MTTKTTKTAKPKKTKVVAPTITAYKGFDKEWKCRDFQYAVGKTFEHAGGVEACKSGFHACEYPLDVFNYYPPNESKFAKVTLSGEFSRESGGDSKVAAGSITIGAEISIPTLVADAVAWVIAHLSPEKPVEHATGDQSASSATGDRSASSATGDNSVAMATGVQSKAKASKGGAIVVCAHDGSYNLIAIRASLVGENGIKADTYYTLSATGEFVESN